MMQTESYVVSTARYVVAVLIATLSMAAAQENKGVVADKKLTTAPATDDPARLIRSRLAELVGKDLAEIKRLLAKVSKSLDKGDVAAAHGHAEAARIRQQEVLSAVQWSSELKSEDAPFFSMIRVRIKRVRPDSVRQSENAIAPFRAWARFLSFFSPVRSIDAEIVQSKVVGRAFQRGTLLARRHPSRLRRGLKAGQPIQLRSDGPEGLQAEFSVGKEYWVVIQPPFVGGSGYSMIVGSDRGPSEIELAVAVR